MIHLAIKYFIRFGQLDIPSVGQLKLSKKEAVFNNGILNAPTEIIEFEIGEGKASKLFYQYIANALEISVDQAAIQYEQFWMHQLQDNTVVNVGSLGSISKSEGNYFWHSNFDSANYYKNIEINQLPQTEIMDEADEVVQHKDKWEIWAIVLAILAILAILLK